MKIIKLLFRLLLCVFILSCENEPVGELGQPQGENPSSGIDLSDNFGIEQQHDFLGRVIDINGNPLQNVSIQIGDNTTTTDSRGVFVMNNALVYERFAYVKATKPGFISGSRALIPTSGTNELTIMLLEELVTETVQSGTNSTVSLPNGASIDFQGRFKEMNGDIYNGTVSVIVHHLLPEEENMRYQMPGMLYAATADNQERMLQTFGMLAVELRGENGQELNLSNENSATITVPLSNELSAIAPPTIPLWYFDEDKGYWIEEGEANLQGDKYVGVVSHFSFWNVDIPVEAVRICITVVDDEGIALEGMQVQLTSELYGTSYGYTDENGEVCGLVPAGESIAIVVNGCTVLYEGSVGPYTADNYNADTIVVTGNEFITETITGTFNDCDGNPVVNGYVLFNMDNTNSYSYNDMINVNNGSFSYSFVNCISNSFDGNTFSLQGVDYDSEQLSDEMSYIFTSPSTNVGNIIACNSVDEYIEYSINGNQETSFFLDIEAVFNENTLELTISVFNDNNCFYMQGVVNPSPYIGTYDNYDYQVSGDTGFIIAECLPDSQSANVTYHLNNLGNVGDYIDITFNGNYQDNQGNTNTITGTIHVLRD